MEPREMFEHQQLAFPSHSQSDDSLSVFWRRHSEGHDGLEAPTCWCLVKSWVYTQAVPWVSQGQGGGPRSLGAAARRLQRCWEVQGWRRQVLQGSVTLLSRTCRTSGEYKQLSDVNRDYPVGGPGPGPGPNICGFCPPPLPHVQLGFLGCFEAQFTEHAGSGAEGAGSAHWGWECWLRGRSTRTWSWSPRALQGCQALCSPTGSWKLHHHVKVFR